jgi:photosystem II stability/assembly factor-like uncharacterized protein
MRHDYSVNLLKNHDRTNTLKRLYRFRALLLSLFLASSCLPSHAASWLPFGPYGGDARAIAADPHDHTHLYLGTAIGWIYESHNGGEEWKRLSMIGKRDDLVLDSIVVDHANPKHILIGAWVLGSHDGGLFVSDDGGATWASQPDMQGQSIRALSASASNPKILIAGTLKGIYRSTDGGSHWQLISPEGSKELHEVESIAIDPVNPQIIYAGTWHLPWKTVDGGEHWTNIKEGVIDDSDVFSIIVDPKEPNVVYASACSGIYKSETAGEKFQKVQGIPSTARRTRVLMQDPQNMNIVFAGTTEGLFRTGDSGKNWLRTTGPEVIVNDVYVDPEDTNRIMLATDRGGVLSSHDGGKSFVDSNRGFTSRQITSYLSDTRQQSTIYVGVVNDKAWGGVFASDNGGLSWAQKSAGLSGRDVFSLGQAVDGTILAGTGHGIYRLKGDLWERVEDVNLSVPPPQDTVKRAGVGPKARVRGAVAGKTAASSKPTTSSTQPKRSGEKGRPFDGGVYSIARGGDMLYAATSVGVLESDTAGNSWKLAAGLESHQWDFVAASKTVAVAATLRTAMLSQDGGQKWVPLTLPESLKQVAAVAVDSSGWVWVGGREGAFVSDDGGASWKTLNNLYVRDVNSMFFDESSQRLFVTAINKYDLIFAVHLPDKIVQYWGSGWNLKMARPVGDHLVGVTLFDGVVVQPRMVDSKDQTGN